MAIRSNLYRFHTLCAVGVSGNTELLCGGCAWRLCHPTVNLDFAKTHYFKRQQRALSRHLIVWWMRSSLRLVSYATLRWILSSDFSRQSSGKGTQQS